MHTEVYLDFKKIYAILEICDTIFLILGGR